jgi:transcriptional regulator with XRE-family HTH domain
MSSKGQHTPPLVGLGHLRRAHGYTLEQVAEGVGAISGTRPNIGTLSAIEGGHRRASDKLMAALLAFYELDGADFVYPRPRIVPQPQRAVA